MKTNTMSTMSQGYIVKKNIHMSVNINYDKEDSTKNSGISLIGLQ